MTQSSGATITMYTHPDCAYSAAAKMEFRRGRVQYTEVDVAKQPDRVADLLAMTNGERITPVIVENGKVTIGFKGGY